MPLRKHFLYTDARGRRSLDHDAYYLLQQRAANGEIPARLFRAASPTFPLSFRKGIPVLQKLLVDSGLTVDIRTFTSRKNARKGRSKFHAVKKELESPRPQIRFTPALDRTVDRTASGLVDWVSSTLPWESTQLAAYRVATEAADAAGI